MAGILACLSLIPCKNDNKKVLIATILLVIFSFTGVFLSVRKNNSMEERVLNGEIGAQISFDTEYGRALIYNAYVREEPVRIFNIEGGYESLAFIDKSKKNDLVSGYTRFYDLMFDINFNDRWSRVLLSKILY